MDIFNYIEDYKDKSFYDEEFNELDSMIFSSLAYLDLQDIVKDKITLRMLGLEYLFKHKEEDELKKGNAQKFAYLLLNAIIDTKRYKDIKCYNYKYIADDNTQFGAITFKLNNSLKVISFEGTDHRISGWKEDFLMGGMFPVNAQKLAIEYVNDTIKLFDASYIIVGHSKGGNLALVSSMYAKKDYKIKKIYSLDGPGLRHEEITSKEYLNIKNKLIHIIPNYSMVGILMESDTFDVIECPKKDFSAHSMINWTINNYSLVRTEQSKMSIGLQTKLKELLTLFKSEEYVDLINAYFKEAETRKITQISELFNIKVAYDLLKGIKEIDEEKKKILLNAIESFITININKNKE